MRARSAPARALSWPVTDGSSHALTAGGALGIAFAYAGIGSSRISAPVNSIPTSRLAINPPVSC